MGEKCENEMSSFKLFHIPVSPIFTFKKKRQHDIGPHGLIELHSGKKQCIHAIS